MTPEEQNRYLLAQFERITARLVALGYASEAIVNDATQQLSVEWTESGKELKKAITRFFDTDNTPPDKLDKNEVFLFVSVVGYDVR